MNCVDAGNVLVHLFLQTSPNYVLTNRKLQYLLIIAQASGLACGRTLFEDDIRNFKNGFVLDTIGNSFLTGCAIVNGRAEDVPISRDAGSFVLPYTKKKMYAISEFPSDEDRKLLIDVFLAFGAYKENTLCALLNGFRGLRKTPFFAVVSKEKISDYLSGMIAGNSNVNHVLFAFIKAQNQADKSIEDSSVEELEDLSAAELPADAAEPEISNTVHEACHEQVEPETAPAQESEDSCDAESEDLSAAELPAEAVEQGSSNAEREGSHEMAGTENALAKELAAENVGATEGLIVVPEPPRAILKGIPSLRNIVAGKRYFVLAEVCSPGDDCRLSVLALDSNRELPVSREVLSDRLYRFSFDGVASDIKISAMLIR